VGTDAIGLESGANHVATDSRGGPMDPSPDYDASDEIEFFFNYVPWGLRGVESGSGYPPPAHPPN
jgi:hypothetical protein